MGGGGGGLSYKLLSMKESPRAKMYTKMIICQIF